MPLITVDYSDTLDESFDRRGFALALHPVAVETVAARIPACKTRFRPVQEFTVGDGEGTDAVVHVGIALLPGRTDEAKAALTEAVLALVQQHIKPTGLTLHVSAETLDLDASYRRI